MGHIAIYNYQEEGIISQGCQAVTNEWGIFRKSRNDILNVSLIHTMKTFLKRGRYWNITLLQNKGITIQILKIWWRWNIFKQVSLNNVKWIEKGFIKREGILQRFSAAIYLHNIISFPRLKTTSLFQVKCIVWSGQQVTVKLFLVFAAISDVTQEQSFLTRDSKNLSQKMTIKCPGKKQKGLFDFTISLSWQTDIKIDISSIYDMSILKCLLHLLSKM